MARAGLGEGWKCLLANDFDHRKGEVYVQNWGPESLKIGDVRSLSEKDFVHSPDLVWASFPCQDLSLAGAGAGLKGNRSGTFWPFWDHIVTLQSTKAPTIIALENVCGTITSHKGLDFAAIADAFASIGYLFGALVIDAALFLPHSRPRLFIIGVKADRANESLFESQPNSTWHTKPLVSAVNRFSHRALKYWRWWKLPVPRNSPKPLSAVVELSGNDWHLPGETSSLLEMMSEANLKKIEKAKSVGSPVIGTMFRRTRPAATGFKVQRVEVRFDGVAGCLRTPAGGSSRQLLIVVHGDSIRTRLISPRESARLMGLDDSYKLPERRNEAYHLTGDGVVVPVVKHIAAHIFEPLLRDSCFRKKEAA